MNNKSLQLQQLNDKMLAFSGIKNVVIPPIGWIKAIRTSIGMTMQQLGNRLSVSKQAVLDIEKREREGLITIKSLRKVARALDLQLVYGFVPNDGTLDAMIEKRAKELATAIVLRTSKSMQLEDQGNTKIRIEKAIEERACLLRYDTPKILWD